MPSSKINTQYFRKLFSDNKDKIQLIIPRKRIQFLKMVNGKLITDKSQMKCNFDCFYYCWKMNLSNDIVWLDDEPPKKKLKITYLLENKSNSTL